jgi:hypothetical protein
MAVDPMMEQTAARLRSGRGPGMGARPPQPVEQAPPEGPGGLAEVAQHLIAALELLQKMGGGGV